MYYIQIFRIFLIIIIISCECQPFWSCAFIAPAGLSETRHFFFSAEKPYLQSVFVRNKNIPFNVHMDVMPKGPGCSSYELECIYKAKNPKLIPQQRLKLLEEALSASAWNNIPVMRKIARLYLDFSDAFEDNPLSKAELWITLALDECIRLQKNYKEFALYNRIATEHLLFEIFMRQRRYDEALVKAEELICMCPYNISSYWKAWKVLMIMNRLDDALECAETEIELNPDNPNGYEHQWRSLYALGVKKHILKGRLEASTFLKDHLSIKNKKLPYQIQRQFSHLIRENYKRKPYPTIIPHAKKRMIVQRHMKEFHDPTSKDNSIRTFYPEHFDENMALEMLKKAQDNLVSSHSVQDLPDGSFLELWPEYMFVAYTDEYDADKAVRMVLIGNARGECIDGYPLFGQGVFAMVNGKRIPIESLSINLYNSDAWNRDTEKNIKLTGGNLRKMIGRHFLRKLKLIEREQLIRLASIDGQYICEDNEHEYYMYQIPLSFSRWKEAIAGDRSPIAFVYLKVHKRSREAIDIRSSYPQEAITILTTKKQSPKKYDHVIIIGQSH